MGRPVEILATRSIKVEFKARTSANLIFFTQIRSMNLCGHLFYSRSGSLIIMIYVYFLSTGHVTFFNHARRLGCRNTIVATGVCSPVFIPEQHAEEVRVKQVRTQYFLNLFDHMHFHSASNYARTFFLLRSIISA